MKRRIAFKKSSCDNKKRFNSKKEADERCLEIEKETGTKLRSYVCSICNGHHLTSKTKAHSKNFMKLKAKIQKENDYRYEKQKEREADFWISKNGW